MIKKRNAKRKQCTLNLSQYFKDSAEKVRVEKLYPDFVQTELHGSLIESDLLVTFFANEKDVFEDINQSDESTEEESTDDDIDNGPMENQVEENKSDDQANLWSTWSLLDDVAQEVTIGTDQDPEAIPPSCQTEILHPLQWTQDLHQNTFEFDHDLHYEIPQEILQLQIYDYCQWMRNEKPIKKIQRQKTRKINRHI